MPPRIPNPTIRCLCLCRGARTLPSSPASSLLLTIPQSSNYATVTKQTTGALYKHKIAKTLAQYAPPPVTNAAKTYPATQPPSYRAATSPKTLDQRVYTSLLRSSPLTVIFQPNAVKTLEWTAIRRELAITLQKVDAGLPEDAPKLAPFIEVKFVNTRMFKAALRIADTRGPDGGLWSYSTSPEAAAGGKKLKNKKSYQLTPLLCGPLGCVTFPALSPAHIEAAMGVLFPVKRGLQRKGFDPAAASGLAKCTLLGARVRERTTGRRKVLDDQEIRGLGKLSSIEEMRGQLVGMLQSVGGGEVVRALESVAIGLGRTVEGWRKMKEEEAGGPKEEEAGGPKEEEAGGPKKEEAKPEA